MLQITCSTAGVSNLFGEVLLWDQLQHASAYLSLAVTQASVYLSVAVTQAH